MRDFIFAWDAYSQQKNSRDNRLVRWTQGFLIFFLTTLTLTSASIQDYLKGNLKSLLGSDQVITRYQPLDVSQRGTLDGMAQMVSETSVMPVSLTYKGAWQRVQLKFVDDAYPVQGALAKSTAPGAAAVPTTSGPEIGSIWVDSRVAAHLRLQVGDEIQVANTSLTLSAILQYEPDRLMEGHTVEMRALVHQNSFSPDSFVSSGRLYRYLLVADASSRAAIGDWVRNTIPEARLIDRHSGRHPLSAYWVRVENFLGLASVLLFFMAAIAINMAGRRQLEKQKHRLALYSSLGVSFGRSMRIALIEWLIAFAVAVIPAVLLAYAAQYFMTLELQNQFAGISAGVHVGAVGKTVLLAFLLLLSVQAPSFLQLRQVSVVSLIRQQPQNGFAVGQLVWGFLTLSMLAAVYSDNWLLTGMTLSAMAAALILMLFVTWAVLSVGELWGRRRAGILPFAFFMMKQRLFSKSTQILGLGLCATLMLFTFMLMKDIGGAMHSQVRTENGNLMISDARSGQLDGIYKWSEETGSIVKHISPFTPGLVVQINGLSVEEFVSQPSEASARLERPIRLSWSEEVPANNRVVGGGWWKENSTDWRQVSVESEVMTDLGLEYGDTLTFDLAGQKVEFTVVASHVFKSGGSSITFWFQVPATALGVLNFEQHHMGSMELPSSAWRQLGDLLEQYPTLSVTSLQELTERFDKTLAIVTKATVGFSAMILLLSLFVIVASVSGFEADDKKRNGLLRSMGLGTDDCLKLTFYEWLVTGLIASVGAVAGTWLAGQLIYQSQFSLTYAPDYGWITGTLGLTCLTVCAVGLYFCRDTLNAPVRELMAE